MEALLEKYNLPPYWLYYQVVVVEKDFARPIIYSGLKLECVATMHHLFVNGMQYAWNMTGQIYVWYFSYPKLVELADYPNYALIKSNDGYVFSLRAIKDFWVSTRGITCIPTLSGGSKEIINRFAIFIVVKHKKFANVNIEIDLKKMKAFILDEEVDLEPWNLGAFML